MMSRKKFIREICSSETSPICLAGNKAGYPFMRDDRPFLSSFKHHLRALRLVGGRGFRAWSRAETEVRHESRLRRRAEEERAANGRGSAGIRAGSEPWEEGANRGWRREADGRGGHARAKARNGKGIRGASRKSRVLRPRSSREGAIEKYPVFRATKRGGVRASLGAF